MIMRSINFNFDDLIVIFLFIIVFPSATIYSKLINFQLIMVHFHQCKQLVFIKFILFHARLVKLSVIHY